MRKQLAGIAVVFAATWGAADAPSVPTHLADAETLVANIRPADNEYLHRGCYIHWPGIDGATAATSWRCCWSTPTTSRRARCGR
jgi:hypothetical protein